MTALRPWDVALDDVIGEIAAESAQLEYGVQSLQESAVGLAGIFGVRSKLRQKACRRLAQRLNQDPINIAAKKWLPPNWRSDSGQLHVLTLMLWGVTDGNLATPSYWESKDEVAGLVASLNDWNPAYVMAVLENPEHPESATEEESPCAKDIEQLESAESAAAYLLESLNLSAHMGTLTVPAIIELPPWGPK